MLLIAVGFDAKGYEGFVAHDPKLWTGDHLFVDKSKATYKALNAKKGSMFGLMKPAVIRAYNAAQGSGVNGNNENALEGLQMGGTYVIDAEGTMILVHRQKVRARAPPLWGPPSRPVAHARPSATAHAASLAAPPRWLTRARRCHRSRRSSRRASSTTPRIPRCSRPRARPPSRQPRRPRPQSL